LGVTKGRRNWFAATNRRSGGDYETKKGKTRKKLETGSNKTGKRNKKPNSGEKKSHLRGRKN